jgi:hypothetical protein
MQLMIRATELKYLAATMLLIVTSSCGVSSDQVTYPDFGRAALSDQALLFGRARVGEAAEVTLRITNVGDDELRVIGFEVVEDTAGEYDNLNEFELVGHAAAAQTIEVAPGEAYAVTVRYTPQNEVRDRGVLRFSTNDPDLAQAEVTLYASSTTLE